jgi:FkbM family methyltransferase
MARRRSILRNAARSYLSRISDEKGLLRLSMAVKKGDPTDVFIRHHDQSDYETLFDCFGDRMHRPPRREILYILDGGANIGFFSLYFSSLLGIQNILAVEPNPNNLPVLERNLRKVGAIIKPAALAARDGYEDFSFCESNSSTLSRLATSAAGADRCRVVTLRLQSALPADWEHSLLWLKLDIEGAEYEVIRDMLGGGIRPAALSVEFHDFDRSACGILSDLEDVGYEIESHAYSVGERDFLQLHAELRS